MLDVISLNWHCLGYYNIKRMEMNKNNTIIQMARENADEILRNLIEIDLKQFKATRGRFLNNNPKNRSQGKIFA